MQRKQQIMALRQPEYPVDPTPSTPQDYLAWERGQSTRHEYDHGHIRMMGGASRQHARIVLNVARHLDALLESGGCEVYANDLRVQLATVHYVYPDIVAACAPLVWLDHSFDTLINPQVIIEVLSPSTAAYDQGRKAAAYRALPSLTDYVLIDSEQMGIQHFSRQGTAWVFYDLATPHDTLTLDGLGVQLSLSTIYARVTWDDAP
jgi:Uma2 family endonuclease